MSSFDSYVGEIREEYKRLGHTNGYRFLSVSKRTLDAPVDIALITSNPGGNRIRNDHPSESCENGVSYLVEDMKSPLKEQVPLLFRKLQQLTRFASSSKELMERSLIGHFVPFRSPSLKELPNREESIRFGRHLWSRILEKSRPRLIV